MLNAIIQLSTLAYGLVLNFMAPMLFGLHAYGEFIAQNALVFFIHRVMAIISEPLISFTQPKDLLVTSLTLNGLVTGIFLLVNHVVPIGSPLLLSGILLTVSVLLSMQALRLRRAHIFFLVTLTAMAALLMLWSALHQFSHSLVWVLEVSAWVPSVGWILYLFTKGAALPSAGRIFETLMTVLRHVPRIISITAVMNVLTSALPVFLAPLLTPRDMGLFKVMTSVMQASTSVFPVSTQALLASFVQHARGVEFYRLVSGMAMLYFAAACFGLTALAMLVPALAPYVSLAVCLPAYYHAVLVERHLTATGHIRPLVIINWVMVVMIMATLVLVDTLWHAALVYASGFALYGVALSVVDSTVRPSKALLGLIAISPVCVYLMQHHLWVGLGYALLVMAAALYYSRPTVSDMKLLWREL